MEHFPETLKLKDAKLIFSKDYHGSALSKIYETCSDSENSCFNSFMIIQTKRLDVFGVITSMPFDKNRSGFYKPVYASLFILRPYSKLYEVNPFSNSDRMIFCGDDKLIIGLAENGTALELDKDLLIGFSYKSDIFDSPPLATQNAPDNNFEIEKIEIFILY